MSSYVFIDMVLKEHVPSYACISLWLEVRCSPSYGVKRRRVRGAPWPVPCPHPRSCPWPWPCPWPARLSAPPKCRAASAINARIL